MSRALGAKIYNEALQRCRIYPLSYSALQRFTAALSNLTRPSSAILTLDDEQTRGDDVSDDVGRHALVDVLVSGVEVPDGQVAGVQDRPRTRQNAVHLQHSSYMGRTYGY